MLRKLTFLLLLLALLPTSAVLAQDEAPEVLLPVAFGELKSLEDAAKEFAEVFEAGAHLKAQKPDHKVPNVVDFAPLTAMPELKSQRAMPDPLRQITPPLGPTPAPILSFDGASDDENAALLGFRIVPPDTQGDVGPAHFFQMTNLIFDIYDKTTGASVLPFGLPALPNNILWAALGPGSICNTNNDGDPIVLYDHDAQRWMVTQFAIGPDGHQCIAVSQTSNPLGGYWLYDFVVTPGGLNDYPKLGVWPDGYYMSINEFAPGFIGAAAVAFEKAEMIIGNPLAQGVKFVLPPTPAATFFSLQPAHWEGMNSPPAGAPNVFAQSFDDQVWGTGAGPDGYQLWEFAVDWTTPAASTFTALPFVTTAPFDANLCGFGPCVPSAGSLLDTLAQFTMYRLQYRNFSTYETLVVNHTVDVTGGNLAGIRWTELRDTGAGWNIFQTGTYSPNAEHRWMGSAAMDSSGNIALGYSVSSAGNNPDIRYTSRMDGDPLGTMTGGEVSCVVGGGSQIGASRWGDYSSMSVDPIDDCTFWYTQEYYQMTNAFDFNTRICSFTFPGCQKGFCGNNTVDLGEVCDGTDLAGETCVSQGFDGGTLACGAGCAAFDTSDCFTCRGGRGSGSWNLPAGPSLGTIFGSLSQGTTPVYQIFGSLTGTAASGTISATLSDGIAPDPDYFVTGTYAGGAFTAQISTPTGTTPVGTITGRYSDNPLLPVIGSFRIGSWQICE